MSSDETINMAMVVTVLMFLLLCVLLLLLYIRYSSAQSELELCRAFRTMDGRARRILGDGRREFGEL